MSRLVIVSNRVALPGENQSGGLAVALRAALQKRGGLWFGWSGKATREASGAMHELVAENIRYITVDLNRNDHEQYYNGFSNRTLWPLLHFRLDLVDYDRSTRDGYYRVNELFAERLAPYLRDNDSVWIHDYHLIPLASFLRQRGIGCRIGFFLHVPMPSADLVAAMPDHQSLFSHMAAYDLVGFQTHTDAARFVSYIRLFTNGRMLSEDILETSGGHRLHVRAFPVGIDTHTIARQAANATSKTAVRALQNSLQHRHLAIGVDRLDYSKGLPERFHGFERYLQRYPGQKGALTFLQIAPVSRSGVREYQHLRSHLEGIAGHVNGAHAEPDWTPLRYVNRNFAQSTLSGFYRASSIGLITPLRDGMNLVAKEYIAAQNPENPGVLILSMFAGAAHELRQALLVNPYDLDGVADAIASAVTMSKTERMDRWRMMMDYLSSHTISDWSHTYLDTLARC